MKLKNWRRAFCCAGILAVLAGCASGPPIDRSYTARSQDSRAQFLIIHYTAGAFNGSLKWLTEGPVSSHYLVNDKPPTIYGLVDENRRAFHAGASSWKGYTQLNASSIGIEIVNTGSKQTPEGTTWFDYPQEQIEAVVALVKKVVKDHDIKPDRILGHSDIAPQRKTDPGPRFPWKRLADEGLIQWPDAAAVAQRRPGFEAQLPDMEWFQRNLEQHGFVVPINGELDEETRRVVAAFQMKYRPTNFDGIPDAETAALLDVLNSPSASTK
ncbi:MAG: N-acetylmuramoyl-L-alanine amidase [Usitatibacteraceae bacterium]